MNKDNIKLSFSYAPSFFINLKKGVVVCKLQAFIVGDYCVMPMSVTGTGIAKCSKDDAFDEDKGMRIALAKAENKCYLNANRYLEMCRDEMLNTLKKIDDFGMKAYRCCAHNEEYIDSVSIKDHPRYVEKVNPLRNVEEIRYVE